ncbi:MAG: nucleotidyltransferase family protein [Clostridia bacterium]|nr:nucleotidyltransferase family protein [Clostridia bacterium]
MNTVDRLTALIRNAVTGESIDISDDFDAAFAAVIKTARRHEIAHLAAWAMLNNGLIKDENNRKTAEKIVYEASYRDTKNNHAYELACDILSGAGIQYIPLKGIVLKKLYPESWMRSSCDVDILVHKADFKHAVSLFCDRGFELDGDMNFHDVSLLYDDSNLELHFSICENMKNIDFVLKKVWENAAPAGENVYFETNDFFAFHHIAHMSYHFLAGGCGIRPFLDIWIMRRNDFFDESKVAELCKTAKIYDFYSTVMHLTKVWFDGAEHTELTRKLEKYTLTGGAYGYFPNNAAAYTVRNGGKVKYLLTLAFPPYRNMKALYPVLNRFPPLLPFCYVYRVFQKTLGGNSKNAHKKYDIIKEQDSAFIKEVASLIKELKLD